MLLANCASAAPHDWAFVQSVGGMSIGTPQPVPASGGDATRWQLPVNVDVSGLRASTRAPSALNSGLVCQATLAHAPGQRIVLQLLTRPASAQSPGSSACPPADLGAIAPGAYNVVYGHEAKPLGQIRIP